MEWWSGNFDDVAAKCLGRRMTYASASISPLDVIVHSLSPEVGGPESTRVAGILPVPVGVVASSQKSVGARWQGTVWAPELTLPFSVGVVYVWTLTPLGAGPSPDPNYPGTCPACRAPAYVGVVPGDVDCSSAKCRLKRSK